VAVVEKLNAAIDTCLAEPANKARLKELGGEDFTGTRGQFADFIAAEIAKWAQVVKFAGVKPA
jgi:tripartite-type tricarboxylate transporter receptor subunit TctC